MDPIQWLIDVLIAFQKLDALQQIVIALTIFGPIYGAFKFSRRGFIKIEQENRELRTENQARKDHETKLKADLSAKDEAIEAWKSKSIKGALEIAEWERGQENEEKAIRALQEAFDAASPTSPPGSATTSWAWRSRTLSTRIFGVPGPAHSWRSSSTRPRR